MSCIYGPRQMGTEDQGWVAHFLIRALEGRADQHLRRRPAGARHPVRRRRGRAPTSPPGGGSTGCAAAPSTSAAGPTNAVSLRQLIGHIEALVGRPVATALRRLARRRPALLRLRRPRRPPRARARPSRAAGARASPSSPTGCARRCRAHAAPSASGGRHPCAASARAPLHLLMTADAVGGVWTYALDLARACAARGVGTTLAVLGPSPDARAAAAARAIPRLELVDTGCRSTGPPTTPPRSPGPARRSPPWRPG